MIWAGLAVLYWLIGVYVSCWDLRLHWGRIDGADITWSMAMFWLIWPLILYSILLKRHFNRSTDEETK